MSPLVDGRAFVSDPDTSRSLRYLSSRSTGTDDYGKLFTPNVFTMKSARHIGDVLSVLHNLAIVHRQGRALSKLRNHSAKSKTDSIKVKVMSAYTESAIDSGPRDNNHLGRQSR
ncbi:5578_t:CDS:2 [Acaulospora colombiana]|uniref:5578_t:CDS:1 n=1 Tax=Acaulospora colombiana TaxID=27376 RepID=A0ACA9N6B5_9GLOM|nr:5578_t:CDS:2 [Acaulospora colombiana]